MKMKKYLFLLVAVASLGLTTGCDDDDDRTVPVPDAVADTFGGMYPNASDVEWTGRNGYLIADFRDGNTDMQAWFTAGGDWRMTETDLLYDQLPEAVRKAFSASEYADWRVEDAERLARAGFEPIYVLEVEKGQTEYELFYAEDGVLIRAVVDADDNDDRDDLLPSELPAAALEFIAGHFTDPRIIEVERERDVLEVEIIEGRKHREVCFDGKGNWLSTRTELQRQEEPAAVLAALDNSQYAGWRVDDIDHFETPADEWYRFELEEPQSDREVELRIRPDGGIF